MLTHTHYAYDAAGNVVETVTADRQPTDSPNAAGPLSDASGTGGPAARVSYVDYYYDAANRPTAASDVGTNGGSAWARPGIVPGRSAADLVTSYGYDAAGNVATVTDPAGLVTAYTYDALGRTTQTVADYTDGTPTDSSNQTTTYAYDGDDHVIDMTAVLPAGQASQETHYDYGVSTAGGSGIDDNDLLHSVWYPDPTTGQASSFQAEYYRYDAVGDPTAYTDRNGTTHAYTYDALGRLTSDAVTAFGPGVDQTVARLGYTYDDAGRLATTTSYGTAAYGPPNILNQTVRTYDGFGQLASEAQAAVGSVTGTTPTVGYTYDAANGDRLTGITYPNGRTLTYNYGTAGSLTSGSSQITSISDGSGVIQSYTYQGLGTPMTATGGNGVTRTTTLDALGRVQSLTYTNRSGTTVDGFTYTYDPDSNVLSRRNLALPGQSELYTFDGLNRLATFARGTLNSTGTAIVGTPTGTASWNYDALGNWNSNTVNGSTTTRANNAQNQVQTVGSATLGYDANGNTLTDNTGQQYVYDAWNRLVAVKNGAGTTIAGYTYDAQGRRVTETHGSATTDLYYSQDWQVLESRDAVTGTPTAQYVWSPDYVDDLVERDDHDPATAGTSLNRRLYAEHDADYNVTSLADASGSMVERYAYDPYGDVTVENPDGTTRGGGTAASSSYGWTILHQGLSLDVATGTYDDRSRVYLVSLGRFAQEDPARYIDGANAYQYQISSPVVNTDSTGLSPAVVLPWWEAILAGGAGGGASGSAGGPGGMVIGAGVGAIVVGGTTILYINHVNAAANAANAAAATPSRTPLQAAIQLMSKAEDEAKAAEEAAERALEAANAAAAAGDCDAGKKYQAYGAAAALAKKLRDAADAAAAAAAALGGEAKNSAEAAAALGYGKRVAPPFNSHGQPVYTNGTDFITPDVDSHNGGSWKHFDRNGRRTGTFDANGNRIGK